MATRLDEYTLQRQLVELPGWSGDTAELRRTVTAPDFMTGIRLVVAVAEVADELDHHPDIAVRWRSVTFTLSTHSVGGVTELDTALAARISALATEYGAS
jgi:4a-hydroxytetrahydrobiopterin dehydratase